uniref:Kinetochore protein NDC80 n=1 Tax=Panagrellus redivivus TaxID=6233 RepID=A0A7E4VGN2_PANRE
MNYDGRQSLRTPRITGRPSNFERQSLFTGNNGRQSLFSARQSLRASDAHGLGRLSCGIPKPRPSNAAAKAPARTPREKPYFDRQKAKVREFLRTNEAKIDPACLKGPNSSQFNALFMFIYVYLDPDFQLTNAKEQIPKILNGLGYPTPIKHSMMQTVYAPSSWPYLLDALAFMIELIEKFDKVDVFGTTFGDSADVQNNRLYAYAYCTRAFQKCVRIKCDANGSNFEEERESFRSRVFNASWPYLVDALAFMIELIEKFEKVDEFETTFGDNADVQKNRFYAYEYCTEAFQKCVRFKCDANGSNFEEEREVFRSRVFNAYDITRGETESEKRLADLNRRVEQLRANCKKDARQELELTVQATKADNLKLKTHIDQLEGYSMTLTQNEASVKENIAKLTASLESLKAEIAEKKTLIRNQPISAQDARQKTQLLQNLRNELKAARSELHEIRNKPMDNNAALYQIFSDIKAEFADMGLQIASVAENFFTPEELTRHGFTSLGEDRNDISAATARAYLAEFDVAVKKLIARMEQEGERARNQASKYRAEELDCDRRLDRGCLEKANIQQEADQVRHGLMRTLNEREQELARAEYKQNVAVERYKAAEARKKKFEAKLLKLDQDIADAEVEQFKQTAQVEDEAIAEGERIVEHVSELFAVYNDIQSKITQKGEELDMIIASYYRGLGIEKPTNENEKPANSA